MSLPHPLTLKRTFTLPSPLHHFGGRELLLVSRDGSPFKGDEDDLSP